MNDAQTLTETPTIEDHLTAHFATAQALKKVVIADPGWVGKEPMTDDKGRLLVDRLATLHWTAKLGVLNKLKDIREAAAWLARDLQDLIEKIDREGVDVLIDSTGVTGDLADKINLGGAELSGLKARLATVEALSKEG